jgi:hypothetical protein
MELGITIRDGWALVKNIYTGETAVCIPGVTEQYMTFVVVERFPTYDDAMLHVAAMRATGVSVDEFRQQPEEGSEHEQEEAEGAEPEPPQIEVAPTVAVGGTDA